MFDFVVLPIVSATKVISFTQEIMVTLMKLTSPIILIIALEPYQELC